MVDVFVKDGVTHTFVLRSREAVVCGESLDGGDTVDTAHAPGDDQQSLARCRECDDMYNDSAEKVLQKEREARASAWLQSAVPSNTSVSNSPLTYALVTAMTFVGGLVLGAVAWVVLRLVAHGTSAFNVPDTPLGKADAASVVVLLLVAGAFAALKETTAWRDKFR